MWLVKALLLLGFLVPQLQLRLVPTVQLVSKLQLQLVPTVQLVPKLQLGNQPNQQGSPLATS